MRNPGAGHLGKNLVIVLALVAAGFFVAWLRFRPYLGNQGRFTDGRRSFEGRSGDGLRFAVWEEPVAVDGEVNSSLDELGASLSPDGRALVFAAAEPGLAADLYLAEVEDGRVGAVRPLAGLNTAADERAPCFADGWLWFASNRAGGAGGLDLWRAPWSNGSFGSAQPLGGELASPHDDTDPAPVPGSEAVVFASDRAGRLTRDFDLYLARPRSAGAGQAPDAGGWEVTLIEDLDTAFDEREPAFTADGRTLFFASDRDGGRGEFDLYRTALVPDARRTSEAATDARRVWVEPEPLDGLNGSGSERAPSPSVDGFTLHFSRSDPRHPDAGFDLQRARTLELFRSPGRPVGWLELLLLAALLLLALLAWLAKRWNQLEVLYKCVLVSLLAHLLLLWYLRDVYPEGGGYELRERGERIRVRLLSDERTESSRNAERSGRLEAERGEPQDRAAPARLAAAEERPSESRPAPTAAPLSKLETPAESSAERAASDARRAESRIRDAVALRDEPVPLERYHGDAPALELRPVVSAAAEERAEASLDPARHRSAAWAWSDRARADTLSRAGSEPSLEILPDRVERSASQAGAPPRSDPASHRVALADSTRPVERRSGEAPRLELSPSEVGGRAHDVLAEPERLSTRSGVARAPTALERPLAAEPALAAGPEDLAPVESGPQPRRPPLQRGDPRLPLVSVEAGATRAERRLEEHAAEAPPAAVLGSARSWEREASPSHARPERIASATGDDPGARPQPRVELERGPSSAGLERREAAFAAPLAELAPTRRSSRAAEVGLRDRPRGRAQPGVEPPVTGRPDPLVGLTPLPPAKPRERSGSVAPPERFETDRPGLAIVDRPQGRERFVVEAPATAEPLPGRLDDTPYRSRQGSEKARALELYGGSMETEAAVAAGLRYLARIQNRHGYWGDVRDRDEKYRHVVVGKTGLALLAFLGAGHTSGSGSEHEGNVEAAIAFLLAIQDERTGHFGDTSAYSHGIATYALAECYALMQGGSVADKRAQRLRAPIEAAVGQILRHQEVGGDERFHGGWGYYYPDDAVFDRWPRASITAWQVMALESARLGGIEVDDEVFERARTFLENCWDEERGAFRYSHDPARLRSSYAVLPGSTPASLFALSLLGSDVGGPRYERAREFVAERAPRGYRYEGDDAFVHRARGNLYFWYYGTLAMFRLGGEPWERWNAAMKETLLPSQEGDGSWRPISIYARYAGDDDQDRSYTTAMNVLTLEIYYRYFTPLLKLR